MITRIVVNICLILILGCSSIRVRKDDDVSIIIEKVINHPKFEQYYHFEDNKRLPIHLITNKKLSSKIYCFKNLVIIHKNIQRKGTNLMLSEFKINEVGSEVKISLPIEGVIVSSSLIKKEENWIIDSFELVQR